jgi:hypothetical protein
MVLLGVKIPINELPEQPNSLGLESGEEGEDTPRVLVETMSLEEDNV